MAVWWSMDTSTAVAPMPSSSMTSKIERREIARRSHCGDDEHEQRSAAAGPAGDGHLLAVVAGDHADDEAQAERDRRDAEGDKNRLCAQRLQPVGGQEAGDRLAGEARHRRERPRGR